MKRFTLLCTAFLSLAAFGQVESSPNLSDLQAARNVAMGGAYEALGYGAETISGNPAALTLYKRYQIEASGAWDIPQGYGFGTVAVADSTNDLAMGLSYHFATFGGPERRFAHLTTLALAYSFGNLIHIGIATRHHVLVGASNTNSVSMNAGLLVRPVEWLNIGFSGHNLISVYNRDVSRYFVASIAGQFLGQLSPAVDVRFDFNQPVVRFAVHAGIEWLISQTFPVRLGYQYDGIANHHYISGGIGWFSEGSGVDLSYRHEVEGQLGKMIALTLKLQL